MTHRPVFHLMAGPNGAGKSTLFRALVRDGIIGADLTFVNADLYERDHLQHIADPEQRSSVARQWADAQRAAKLLAKESFASETVFSHASKLALIEEAIAHGYVVVLYIVARRPATPVGARAAPRKRGRPQRAARPHSCALPTHVGKSIKGRPSCNSGLPV